MRLVPVKMDTDLSAPCWKMTCNCSVCQKNFKLSVMFANLDGKSFEAYYCPTCKLLKDVNIIK